MKKLITTNKITTVLRQEKKKRKILTTNEIQPRKFDNPGKGKPSGGSISTSDLQDTKEKVAVPCRESTRKRKKK